MTRRDWGSWVLVLFVAVFVVPLVSATDRPMPAQVWPTDEPCPTALAACWLTAEWEHRLYQRCEEYAPMTIEALRATVDALSTRLHRTPDGPDPTPTARPSWRALLPMAVRGW
jgi:hypothetical protein